MRQRVHARGFGPRRQRDLLEHTKDGEDEEGSEEGEGKDDESTRQARAAECASVQRHWHHRTCCRHWTMMRAAAERTMESRLYCNVYNGGAVSGDPPDASDERESRSGLRLIQG